ncbi:hypothetical protein HBB16_08355 [Pseudonocardia sp. MCCB 268]|nr:hypothetical protein [Pseudonocardia cytotoxica]
MTATTTGPAFTWWGSEIGVLGAGRSAEPRWPCSPARRTTTTDPHDLDVARSAARRRVRPRDVDGLPGLGRAGVDRTSHHPQPRRAVRRDHPGPRCSDVPRVVTDVSQDTGTELAIYRGDHDARGSDRDLRGSAVVETEVSA